jgi:hypothetical protein
MSEVVLVRRFGLNVFGSRAMRSARRDGLSPAMTNPVRGQQNGVKWTYPPTHVSMIKPD